MSPYVAYCRGRIRAALSPEEVDRYFGADLPVVVGFVLGSVDSEAEGKPLPTEASVEAEVALRLAAVPPAAPPPPRAEQAERPRWIGDPLPSPSPAG